MITLLYDLMMSSSKVLSREVGEARDDLTRLNLCHHHKTQQLSRQSHRVEDHSIHEQYHSNLMEYH